MSNWISRLEVFLKLGLGKIPWKTLVSEFTVSKVVGWIYLLLGA